MKKIIISSWICFFIGIVFIILHYPGGALLAIIGTLLHFLNSVVFINRNYKENIESSIMNLSISTWLIYLLFRFLYWPSPRIIGVPLIFLIPFSLSIVFFVLTIKNKKKIGLKQLTLIVLFLLGLTISGMNAHRVFYYFNLSALNSQENRIEYSKVWDKYSWFLYLSNKQNESIEANKKAQSIVEECISNTQNDEFFRIQNVLRNHESLIKDQNWKTYP